MSSVQLVQKHQCFSGEQRFYQHHSQVLNVDMKFSAFIPQRALQGQTCAAVFYLAGLTCTEETFAIKAHGQYWANRLGLILIMPDTSPRGDGVADDAHWDLGQGAGFYVNATQAPWSAHFHMEDYISKELYDLVVGEFGLDTKKIGIMGHSMGGHGALTLAYKFPEKFNSVSAFAPIAAPTQCPWGEKAFSHYLGDDRSVWVNHDAVELIKKYGKKFDLILVDQGKADQFYAQLNPELLQQACQTVGQPLTLRLHDGFDHGYYFIQSFIEDHLQHHALALGE